MCKLEDRLRSPQSPGGFGSVSAQAMPILSWATEDVAEQPVRFPSHLQRKHKERETKPEHPDSERFRIEGIREMEGGLKYTRNRFTHIVKTMDGLVSLVLHYKAKLMVLPQAWWAMAGCRIARYFGFPSIQQGSVSSLPSSSSLGQGLSQHSYMIPLEVGLPDYSGTDS